MHMTELTLSHAIAALEASQHISARIVGASHNENEIAHAISTITHELETSTTQAVDAFSAYLTAHMALVSATTAGTIIYADMGVCQRIDEDFPTYATMEATASEIAATTGMPPHGMIIFARPIVEDIIAMFWTTRPAVVLAQLDEETEAPATETHERLALHAGICHLDESAKQTLLLPNTELISFQLDDNPVLTINPVLTAAAYVAARTHAGEFEAHATPTYARLGDAQGVQYPLTITEITPAKEAPTS